MSPMANRQALATLRNGLQPRRLVHSSSPTRATLASPPSFTLEEADEVILAPIFDIFDAPSRLGEAREFIREKRSSASSERDVSSSSASSPFSVPLPRPLPATLPPAIIFDGPAHPRNIPLAFHSRRKQPPVAPSSTRSHHTPSVARLESSEPLIQLFDGPARITRYQHKSSSSKGNSNSGLILLGLAGAVGCATIAKDQFDGSSSSNDRLSS
ncbi:hypothetical protein BDQ12DRAFT_729467 [Crucibulum laeve]|uniref:Uncharacterized protein n=1 Tax=Crucibulum laeve TaxID=68775 RepID=A0A5C3LFF4_9AGAR|nr:hypothetical protein BDQ12DRAFT_729467 [Crucibulum laeve]